VVSDYARAIKRERPMEWERDVSLLALSLGRCAVTLDLISDWWMDVHSDRATGFIDKDGRYRDSLFGRGR
jgi:hypothetical protein